MTWTKFKSGGTGKLSFGIVIEGWPHVWVTDKSVDNVVSDDRTVYVGLLYEGLELHERALPGEGKLEVDAITFRVVSPGPADEATASFADFQKPVATLASELSTTATTLALVGSTTLADGYYYLGTETVQVSTYPTIARTQWDSNAQKHFVSDFAGELATYVYDTPPTLEGRRVELYVWEESDTKTLAGGTVIWRGHFTAPARLSGDGLTWQLRAEHIISLFRQKVVGTPTELHPAGIYHHYQCAAVVAGYFNGTETDLNYVTGYHKSERDLIEDINDKIQTVIYTDLSVTTGNIASIGIDRTALGYSIMMRTGASPPTSFSVVVGSPLMGYGVGAEWIKASTEEPVKFDALAANTDYIVDLSIFGAEAGLVGVGAIGGVGGQGGNTPKDALPTEYVFPTTFFGPANLFTFDGKPLSTDASASTTAPVYRIYVDKDLSTVITDEAIHIEDTNNPNGLYRISAISFDANNDPYIDIASPLTISIQGGKGWNAANKAWGGTQNAHVPALGHLSGETTIQPVIDYGTGSLANFVGELITQGADANAGVAPYIVLDDIGNFVFWDGALNVGARSYLFVDSVSIEDIVSQELLLVGGMLYTDSSGKIAARPAPLIASTAVASDTIDTSHIITPADDYGSWPVVDFQRDGLVNQVTVQEGYDPTEGEWKGRPFRIIDKSSVAEHKNRGRGAIEIKPYSQAASDAITDVLAANIGGRYLQLMGRPYLAITLTVGYTLFDLLLGDVVLLTCPHVPDGQGGRGLTSRRAFVVERRWNFEPDSNKFGELVLWVLIDEPIGYAPSAFITGQSNTAGNTWAITADSTSTMNIGWSTLGDGKVLQHFSANDLVEVMIFDNLSLASPLTGTVGSVSTSTDQITVTFTSTWSPGSDTWVLEFQADGGSGTTNMRKYAYVSDANQLLADGSVTRRFA